MKRAIPRTLDMLNGAWLGNTVKENKAKWFLNRAKKSDKKKKLEKASRKRNRK